MGASGRLLTTGFSRHSDRQYSIWDQNDLSKPLTTDTIDSSSGVVFPFYDSDTNIVFLAGKGDGNIRYYEITAEPPYIHFLSQFLSGNPQVSATLLMRAPLTVVSARAGFHAKAWSQHPHLRDFPLL